MSLCRLTVIAYETGIDEGGFDSKDLEFGEACAEWLLQDGYVVEPFYKFDLERFASWCREKRELLLLGVPRRYLMSAGTVGTLLAIARVGAGASSAPEPRRTAMTCYGQVNSGRWCQEHYETASRDARRRAKVLREAGYDVHVVSLGTQVTNVGYVKMTMVDIRPGANADTTNLPTVEVVRV